LKIKPSHEGKLDVSVWVCLYGGLLCIAAAVALWDSDPELASWVGGAGSLATALGIVLIYIRSRLK
jgi:hypothetical protein